jgi:hypothetical protein
MIIRLRSVRPLVIGAVFLAGLLAVYLALQVHSVYRTDVSEHAAPPLNRGKNGIWLAHRWFDDTGRKVLSADEIRKMALRCTRLGISYLLVHVGPIDAKGKLPPANPGKFAATRALFARYAPSAVWLAWAGAPNAQYLGKAEDTLALGDLQARRNLLGGLRELFSLGFAGVHYDVEPVEDGDAHFLDLLRDTRSGFPDKLLSVAAPQLQPPGLPKFIPGMRRLWSSQYYAAVGELSDQVTLMGYDTFQPTQELYSRYLANQVRELRQVLRCEFLVGVPTYEDNPPYHNPDAETLGAGLEGARRGGAHAVAIYADWTTSQSEWDTFERVWQAPQLGNSAR